MLPLSEQETPIPDDQMMVNDMDDANFHNGSFMVMDDNVDPDGNQLDPNGPQTNGLHQSLPQDPNPMMPTNPFPMAPNLPMADHPDGASPNLYRPIDTALTQSVLLQPIHENHAAHDRRETYQHITTLEPFHNKMSIEYRGHQKFKKKRSKRRRKKRGRDDLEDDGHDVDFDDDEEYEIWRRPPADIDANNDGRHQIMMQYGNIEGMDPVLELLLEDETQCDVLERLSSI